MLQEKWSERRQSYDIVVVGSGYGGAITAARLAVAELDSKPSVCVLERGKEWPVGQFPETVEGILKAARGPGNPLGLYELLNHADISVIKGSGLGGTSLINANVAIVPDREVFEQINWPKSVTYDILQPYYQRAREVLATNPHPRALELAKVRALDRRAQEMGRSAVPLDIAVNFAINGTNPYGIEQEPCIDCGNCVTGCNIGAKNTLCMNYLPMARKAGATIFAQTKVEWLEKLGDGGWRIHGRHYDDNGDSDAFSLDAREVVLCAGSLNSTEILLRSEMRGLSVSPALGTKFNGNGDFFGLAYNGDFGTEVLGYPPKDLPPAPGNSPAPGPNIVGIVRYNGDLPASQRITIEDFSFPSAYVDAAKIVFGAIRGEDTVAGNEDAQRARLSLDLNPASRSHNPDGAMSHTMLYLVMGQDDARGTILFEAPWNEPDGRIQISWDQVGQQQIFTRMNEELRRHARSQRANFISNPTWSVFNLRHLVTAHPLGGCPMGEDYLQGAVDEFGRVFADDGTVHRGLYVSDGAVLPSALGVNPFMTISAITERFVERRIRDLAGDPYPEPKRVATMSTVDPIKVAEFNEGQLEALFRRSKTLSIDRMLNQGGAPVIDLAKRVIRNDRYWKGFFPKAHVLNAMSSAIFTGFKKEFRKETNRYLGITSDTDGRIRVRNSLETVTVSHDKGTLEAGEYILLRYLDFPWQAYYDVFKVINDDLLIGRVYIGQYPNGVRLFTFPMVRRYGFDHMTVDDHRALFDQGAVPTKADLDGVWRMDVISNNNHAGAAAYLRFDAKPDGRLEASYQFMGLIEGLVLPSFLKEHFQLNDFTTFHDEIRKVDKDMLIGKWVTAIPPVLASQPGPASLGIFQTEAGGQFGFYYTLSRTTNKGLPTNRLLSPFLGARLPDGVSLKFSEEMTGWYFPGVLAPGPGRDGDLAIARRIPASGIPEGVVSCGFKAGMVVRDLNEFIDGAEHEAQLMGTISLDRFEGEESVTLAMDADNSRFNYMRVNPATGEAEMKYHIEFRTRPGRRFTLEGTKYLQKDKAGLVPSLREILVDYTTLYCHVYEELDGGRRETGTAYLKFRTFEDLAAVGSLAAFLNSFTVTGTDDPVIQFQARMRFLAFTAQFVGREYDPLAPDIGLADHVRAEVLRGAETPDYFSTQPAVTLQSILRDTPTLPIEKLLNKGSVRIDFEKQRIFRDSFWKGSFAKDSLLGWEERVRNSLLGHPAEDMGRIFTGGSFWKRFDQVDNGVAKGYVVNYEIAALPGLPEVRQVSYPDNNRRYFKKGDAVLLLNYTNDPYRIVYDIIKVIDDQNAIGVMHLGTFPNGLEFATFVMARQNYPFENLSVEDHRQIFSNPHTSIPTGAQLEGDWNGHLILLATPNSSLLNQVNPVLFHVTFHTDGGKVKALWKCGLLNREAETNFTGDSTQVLDSDFLHTGIRRIDKDTLIAKWVLGEATPLLLRGLDNFLESQGGRLEFYCILKRK